MRSAFATRVMVPRFLVATTSLIVLVALAGSIRAETLKPAPVPAPEPMAPEVGTTRANLESSFSSEVNAKERYLAAAKQADREGYPYVAQLFRACARAEEAHANLHVTAIAWGGGEAKAMLERLAIGSTPENLQTAVSLETYEATQVYPALLARAREQNNSAAVRSMNLALAAERQHMQLLGEAQQTLRAQRPVAQLYVCEQCGNTVTAMDFKKCPHCFAGRRQFAAVE